MDDHSLSLVHLIKCD